MIDKIEKRSLIVMVIANIIMAFGGWITFYLTNSEAMLLDGNFSFVLAIATIIAIVISKHKHRKTATFPFGSYAYEAAFVLAKGLLILGIIIVAFIQNTVKIIDFFNGEKLEPVVLTPIYYYTVFILILTAVLIIYFKHQNKKINNRSSMLLVEESSAKIDGVLTLVTGIAFVVISFISNGSKLDFLLNIGDSLIVVVLAAIMIKIPFGIIKSSFIELGGGTLQNKEDRNEIETIVNDIIDDSYSYETFISKIGSGYLVAVYIEHNNNTDSIKTIISDQKKIKDKLSVKYPVLSVEISIKD